MALAQILGRHGVVRETHSMSDLDTAIAQFRAENVGAIAIVGGDGTVHHTVTRVLHEYAAHHVTPPPFALLGGGTMNIVARSIGVNGASPERHLKSLQFALTNGTVSQTKRHVLSIEGRYGFMFGVGVIEGFLAEYYKAGSPTALTAAATFTRAIAGAFGFGSTLKRIARPFIGSVSIELVSPSPQGRGGRGVRSYDWEERSYLAVAAGTIEQLGFGFKPFCRYNAEPNTFHILGVVASPSHLAKYLGHIRLGRELPESVAVQATTRRAILRSNSPIAYMFDGELYQAKADLEIRIGEKIRFLRDRL